MGKVGVSIDRHLREHFRGRAPDNGARSSENYYWARKRRMVLDLIDAHRAEFRATAPPG